MRQKRQLQRLHPEAAGAPPGQQAAAAAAPPPGKLAAPLLPTPEDLVAAWGTPQSQQQLQDSKRLTAGARGLAAPQAAPAGAGRVGSGGISPSMPSAAAGSQQPAGKSTGGSSSSSATALSRFLKQLQQGGGKQGGPPKQPPPPAAPKQPTKAQHPQRSLHWRAITNLKRGQVGPASAPAPAAAMPSSSGGGQPLAAMPSSTSMGNWALGKPQPLKTGQLQQLQEQRAIDAMFDSSSDDAEVEVMTHAAPTLLLPTLLLPPLQRVLSVPVPAGWAQRAVPQWQRHARQQAQAWEAEQAPSPQSGLSLLADIAAIMAQPPAAAARVRRQRAAVQLQLSPTPKRKQTDRQEEESPEWEGVESSSDVEQPQRKQQRNSAAVAQKPTQLQQNEQRQPGVGRVHDLFLHWLRVGVSGESGGYRRVPPAFLVHGTAVASAPSRPCLLLLQAQPGQRANSSECQQWAYERHISRGRLE